MVENANIWSSPEETNPLSLLHLLDSGLLPPSIGLCKSVKYAKKLDNKWVFYTESSIPLQIATSSFLQLYLAYIRNM